MRFDMVKYMMRHVMVLTHNHLFVLGLAVTLAIGTLLDTHGAFLVGVPPRGAVHERFLLETEDGISRDAFLVDLGRVEMRPHPAAGEGWRVGVRHCVGRPGTS